MRPGVAVFDPDGTIIPAEARGVNFLRVLQSQTSPVFDGDYKSMQVSLVKRMANRWSGRIAYTLQRSNYVGIGNPDARRVWLDNDPRADYGEFSSNRTNVLAASGTWNPWRSLTFATVVSAISGAPINETVGRDVNGDLDNNDRPIAGIDDLLRPIVSELDGQGRAVPYGIRGPESVTVDLSFRYQLPLGGRLDSLDFFFDMFNVVQPPERSGADRQPLSRRTSWCRPSAQFPRQIAVRHPAAFLRRTDVGRARDRR